ncbi:hypothetical protein DFQ29_003684 [Apophysomyces sp. BC1021]|nr:hypothetical protein DFQ29_003684 [Apophysomyces sp. BC1021]
MSGHNYEVVTTHFNEHLWNLGKKSNWRAVMGNNFLGWFVPFEGGLGDGYTYPYSEQAYHKIVERAKRQRDMMNPPPLSKFHQVDDDTVLDIGEMHY